MPEGLGQIEGGRLIEGLRELGVAPGGIEVVAFTHLHDDHIGWAARSTPDGREVFAGAQFFAGEPEWRWWSGAVDPRRAALLGRRMNAAADGREIFPGVTAWSTPGHTPGHTAYVVESGGRRLIAFGDVMHSPIQFADPRWGAANDFDRTRSVASRQAVIAELGDEKATGFGGHFADVVFGRLTAVPGERVPWEPVDATD
ncbi:MAG: MBL fold metallo-hydrolase, partial [Catenulispora sp.]|nr:MBL fold metallo-hydrolase [Catenulispora sp.]